MKKVALVTGASRGIGRAIAEQLARDGYAIALHYSSRAADARDVLTAITNKGGEAFLVEADFTKASGVSSFMQQLHQQIGDEKVEVLVNNAGIGTSQIFSDTTEEEFDLLFNVNIKAPFFLTQQILPILKDGGSIVNISSGVTRIAYPQIMAYNLTKGAINTFTLHLAALLGERKIRVNAVMPGIVDTEANASWLPTPDGQRHASGMSVLKRVGQPSDIADIVSFLASAKSRWITGQMIDATGGSHL